MANPFCHVELQTDDVDRAKKFYTDLLDWEIEDMPMGPMTYSMIKVGEGVGGGMMKNPVPDAPAHWLAYIQVDDVEVTEQKAKSLGATILMGKTEVPNAGWFSTISDPTGAVISFWQQMAHGS